MRAFFCGSAGRYRGGVGAEHVLEGPCRLAAQFVPVAHEQCPAQLPGVGNAFQQVDGDEGLARAGRQGQQGALRLPGLYAACDLFQYGPDGGVLIIAPRRFAARVAHEQGPGDRLGQAEALPLLVARPQLTRRRELVDGTWRCPSAR